MRKSSASGLVVALPLLTAITVVAACSSSKPPPPSTPTSTPDAGPAVGDANVGMAAPADAAAAGPVFFTTPEAGAAQTSDAGAGGAAPIITEGVLDSAIDLAITTASPKVAPKMDKEGAPGRATLKEGEHFSMVVTLQPNRCYTFVAFSPPGNIGQIDMTLMGVALAIEAGKSSPPDKTMPGLSVMGKGKTPICPVLPVPVPYRVDVVAKKGAGRMGVQAFARAR